MAYKEIILYSLYMPSYFLGTFKSPINFHTSHLLNIPIYSSTKNGNVSVVLKFPA